MNKKEIESYLKQKYSEKTAKDVNDIISYILDKKSSGKSGNSQKSRGEESEQDGKKQEEDPLDQQEGGFQQSDFRKGDKTGSKKSGKSKYKNKDAADLEDISEQLGDLDDQSDEDFDDAMKELEADMLKHLESRNLKSDKEDDEETTKIQKLPEWNYEDKKYSSKAKFEKTRYDLSKLDKENYIESLKIFESKYQYLVEEVKEYLAKLKKNSLSLERGVKKGRINSKLARIEVSKIVSGRRPTDKIYDKPIIKEKNYCVGILIDRSGSTCEGVYGTDMDVIDIEKYAGLILGEAIKEIGDDFCVYSFSENDECILGLEELKSFKDKWDTRTKYKVASLKPGNENRDGAAIRAMVQEMEKFNKKKILFLLSDGRPSAENYRSKYALADTIKAIEEVESKGIKVVYLSIDSGRDSYFGELAKSCTYARKFKELVNLPKQIADIYLDLRFK